MYDTHAANHDASALHIGVAISRYHREVTDALLAGAVSAFHEAGGEDQRLRVVEAPGTWELTAICRAMALGRPAIDAIVALGCVLTGETRHDQYIAQGVTHGLTAITTDTGMPIAFGVLTCQSLDQALARSAGAGHGGNMNKGVEAMRAAIAAANAVRTLRRVDGSMR